MARRVDGVQSPGLGTQIQIDETGQSVGSQRREATGTRGHVPTGRGHERTPRQGVQLPARITTSATADGMPVNSGTDSRAVVIRPGAFASITPETGEALQAGVRVQAPEGHRADWSGRRTERGIVNEREQALVAACTERNVKFTVDDGELIFDYDDIVSWRLIDPEDFEEFRLMCEES